jgi:hypothetical protein
VIRSELGPGSVRILFPVCKQSSSEIFQRGNQFSLIGFQFQHIVLRPQVKPHIPRHQRIGDDGGKTLQKGAPVLLFQSVQQIMSRLHHCSGRYLLIARFVLADLAQEELKQPYTFSKL